MEELHTWFQETKLTQYEDMFVENGYDDLEVIAAITDGELREIGVNLPGHRKKILLKASSLRKKMKLDDVDEDSKQVHSNTKTGLLRFICTLNLCGMIQDSIPDSYALKLVTLNASNCRIIGHFTYMCKE